MEKKMFWKKKNKEPKKVKTITLQRFQPIFTTIDGIVHEGIDWYKWVNADGLLCSVPKYMMISVKEDGYLEDKNNKAMYPLNNIISIEWKLLEEKIVLDNFYHQVYFSDKEVEKMTEYKGE